MPDSIKNTGDWRYAFLALLALTGCAIILYVLSGAGWFLSGALLLLGVGIAVSFAHVRLFSLYSYFVISYVSLNLISLFIVGYSGEEGGDYVWMTLSALCLFLLGYFVFLGKSPERDFLLLENISSSIKTIRDGRFFLLLLPVIISALFIMIEVASSGGILAHTRAATKEEAGMLFLLIKYLLVFAMPFCFLMGLGLRQRKGSVRFLVFILFFLSLIIFFFGLRTRSYIVGPTMTFFAGYFCSYIMNYKERKVSIPIRAVVPMFLVLALVLVVSAYSRFYRGALEVQGSVETSAVFEQTISNGDLGYGLIINDIMKKFKGDRVWLYGQSYYRLLFILVPRSIWKDKPENTQQIVGEVMGGKVEYFTLPPGIQGDAYINFGSMGVLIFLIFGAVFARIDSKNSPVLILSTSSSFLPIYHLARGGFTNPVIMIFVIFVGSYLVNRFYLNRKCGD